MNDFTTVDALTLEMISIMALDELRTAATHRRIDNGHPVFLGLVRTEAYWRARHATIRWAAGSFYLGSMMALFDNRMTYPLLGRFHTHLSGALWMLATDLQIVDGTSFVELPEEPPACLARNNDVALMMTLDRTHGQFRVRAAVV